MERPEHASILDDVAAMSRADGDGMLGHIASFPEQLTEGWRISRELESPWAAPSSVAVLGMGGSAIGADLAAGIWPDRLRVPLWVVRGYDLPAWVGPDTLVVASSRSGDTEETLSALGAALERRCPVVAVTAGGALGRVATAAGLPLVSMPERGSPRVVMGWSLAILAGILERAGVLELDEAELSRGAAAAATMIERCAPEVPTSQNPAKQLAWSLVDRLIIVAGAGFMAPVARRWKGQLNENGKAVAVFEELPEATHNTVVGFEQPESLRDHLAVVFLASRLVHPRDSLRAQLTADLLETGHIWHTFVEPDADGRLEQASAALVLGDYVSAYLAFTYGVDPSPVDVITHIREQLSLSDQADRG